MGYAVKILCDSIGPSGKRLTTIEVTFPRIVLAEFNTHRLFSRNSASSRAIPVAKRIEAVKADPFVPEQFGKNKRGMQAGEAMVGDEAIVAEQLWRNACQEAIHYASLLAGLGVHKQIANRLIEPFSWHTVIVSATEWDNFLGLRCAVDENGNPLADPHIYRPACLMRNAVQASEPQILTTGKWHLPLVATEDYREFDLPDLRRLSTARCARVSYLTHDGRRAPEEDFALHDKLMKSGHWSPFEHVAEALWTPEPSGNFMGWRQYRKYFVSEHVGPIRADGPTICIALDRTEKGSTE